MSYCPPNRGNSTFLYNRSGSDTLQLQVSRVVGFFERLYPNQDNAPVQGMPAIRRNVRYAGMLLAANGNQLVPDATHLIDAMGLYPKVPTPWAQFINEALAKHPERLRRPAHYFTEIYPKHRDQPGQTSTFMGVIDPYDLDENLGAQYGANSWGVDLSLVEQGYLIIFDGQYLPEEEHKAGMTWIFTRCMELFKARGPRRDVVGFVVDELDNLVSTENPLLESDFKKLITQYGRNYGVSSFYTYQEVTQPPKGLALAMNMVGYSLYAGSSDPEAVKKLVTLLNDHRPYWQKSVRRTPWRDFTNEDTGETWIEEDPQYFGPPEQDRLNEVEHRERAGLTFALSMVDKEGSASRPRGLMNIHYIVNTHRFDGEEEPLEECKKRLVQKYGRRVLDIQKEIEARQPGAPKALTVRKPTTPASSRQAIPADALADGQRPAPPPGLSRN